MFFLLCPYSDYNDGGKELQDSANQLDIELLGSCDEPGSELYLRVISRKQGRI